MDQDKILDYLVYNRSHLLNEVKSLMDRKTYIYKIEHMVFHDDIQKQYESNLRSVIAHDIVKNLNVTIEDVLVILENLNINDYLERENYERSI